MFKRRVFAVVCSLCLVCSTLSGVAYGAGSLEDILQGVDPWEDFNDVSNAIQSIGNSVPSSAVLDDKLWVGTDDGSSVESPSPVAGEEESGEEGIEPLSLPYPEDNNYAQIRVSSLDSFAWRLNPYLATTRYDYIGISSKVTIPSNGIYTLPIGSRSDSTPITEPSGNGIRFEISDGAYFDIMTLAPSSGLPLISTSEFSKVNVAGKVGSILQFRITGSTYYPVYPSGVAILINGEVASDVYALSSNASVTALISESIALSESVYTVGYRFYFEKYLYFSDSSVSARSSYARLVLTDTCEFVGGNLDSGDVVGEQQKTNGLLSGLISLVQSIVSGIGTIVQSIGNIVTAIAELPGKIWAVISDGLQLLFVPSTDELDSIHDKWQELCETKFGFIYQAYQMLENVWSTLIGGWASHKDYTFRFPGISFDMLGETYHVVEPQVIDFDNQLMAVLRAPLGTIVSIVCVLAVVNLFEHMFFAFISGKSYFDFLRGGAGEEG